MDAETILRGILIIGGAASLFGFLRAMRKEVIYSCKCNAKTSACIVRYAKSNDSQTHDIQLFPVVTYTVNGKQYTRKSEVFSKNMIKKNVQIRYWEKNPRYFYIEEIGRPHMRSISIICFLLFLGFLTGMLLVIKLGQHGNY